MQKSKGTYVQHFDNCVCCKLLGKSGKMTLRAPGRKVQHPKPRDRLANKTIQLNLVIESLDAVMTKVHCERIVSPAPCQSMQIEKGSFCIRKNDRNGACVARGGEGGLGVPRRSRKSSLGNAAVTPDCEAAIHSRSNYSISATKSDEE